MLSARSAHPRSNSDSGGVVDTETNLDRTQHPTTSRHLNRDRLNLQQCLRRAPRWAAGAHVRMISATVPRTSRHGRAFRRTLLQTSERFVSCPHVAMPLKLGNLTQRCEGLGSCPAAAPLCVFHFACAPFGCGWDALVLPLPDRPGLLTVPPGARWLTHRPEPMPERPSSGRRSDGTPPARSSGPAAVRASSTAPTAGPLRCPR